MMNAIKSDYHVHTNFSDDSDATPGMQAQEAIRKGLSTICITDHQDTDYPEPIFNIDFNAYYPAILKTREEYEGKLDVRIGLEYGMQPHLGEDFHRIEGMFPFDFIIGSIHLVDGEDPYYRKIFEGRTDGEAYRRAFEVTLECMRKIKDFDSLGHMDYIVRYGKYKAEGFEYRAYSDILDEILRYLITHGKALEVNTGGIRANLPFPHPHPDILRRYKELGGEMITIGSDAHEPLGLASGFGDVAAHLKSLGFKYYTEFKERKPAFCAFS